MKAIVNTSLEDLPGEIWKDILDYEDLYKVSNKGRIKSLDSFIVTRNGVKKFRVGRILSPYVHSINGYYLPVLSKNNKHQTVYLHRIVAESFIPNPDNKPEINHKSGDKSDNCSENLGWVTHLENMQHARKIGLIDDRGEKSKNSKLTTEDIIKIKLLYDSGDFTLKQLGIKYNIAFQHIQKIVSNKTWKHLYETSNSFNFYPERL